MTENNQVEVSTEIVNPPEQEKLGSSRSIDELGGIEGTANERITSMDVSSGDLLTSQTVNTDDQTLDVESTNAVEDSSSLEFEQGAKGCLNMLSRSKSGQEQPKRKKKKKRRKEKFSFKKLIKRIIYGPGSSHKYEYLSANQILAKKKRNDLFFFEGSETDRKDYVSSMAYKEYAEYGIALGGRLPVSPKELGIII